MAKQLISIQKYPFSDQLIEAVDARDLHLFLEVGRVFAAWISDRIKQYGFEEGCDYAVVENLSNPNPESAKSRQQKKKDYFITLDMAKELAMVERNEKGRQARRYFIECEKAYRHKPQKVALVDQLTPLLNGPEVRLQTVMDTYKQICERQNKTVHIDALVRNYLGVRSLKAISASDADRAIVMLQQLIAIESDSSWSNEQLAHVPFSMLFQMCNQTAYAHRLLEQLAGLTHQMGITLDEVEGYMGHSMTTNRSHRNH